MTSTDSAMAEVTRDVAAGFTEAINTLRETVGSTTSTPSEVGSALGEAVTDMSAAAAGFGNGLGEAVEAVARESFGDGVAGTAGTAAMSTLGEAMEAVTEISSSAGAAVGEVAGSVIGGVGGAAGHLAEAGGALRDGDLGGAVRDVGEAVKDLGEAAVDGTATVATTVGVMAAEAVEGGAAVGREIVTGLVDTGAATVGAVRDAVSPDVALFDGPVVAAVIGAGATPAAGVTVTSEDQGDFPGDDDRADAGTAEVTGGAAPGDGVDASFPGDDEPAGDADTAEAAETTVGTGTSESNSSDGDDGFGE